MDSAKAEVDLGPVRRLVGIAGKGDEAGEGRRLRRNVRKDVGGEGENGFRDGVNRSGPRAEGEWALGRAAKGRGKTESAKAKVALGSVFREKKVLRSALRAKGTGKTDGGEARESEGDVYKATAAERMSLCMKERNAGNYCQL